MYCNRILYRIGIMHLDMSLEELGRAPDKSVWIDIEILTCDSAKYEIRNRNCVASQGEKTE